MSCVRAEIDMQRKLGDFVKSNSRLHFVAIGGIGVSAVAKIFLQGGYKVSGSDIKENKNTEYLKQLGAKIYIGHEQENVKTADVIIASSAIKNDNPEIVAAQRLGIPIFHRSQALAYLMSKKISIGVSGTHGKTTTSGMTAFVLNKLAEDVSFAVGGIVPELKTNAQYGSGDYFVSELDESDGTILMYQPDVTVVTNLELDHVDFYQDGFEQILKTFEQFSANLKPDAKLVVNADCEGNQELLRRIGKDNVILYTTSGTELCGYAKVYQAKNIKIQGLGSTSDIWLNGEFLGEMKLNVPSEHNVSDALSVVASLMEKGFEFDQIASNLSGFTGMGRRFEFVGEFAGAKFIDDYAHHPTEVKATIKSALNALSSQRKGRVVVVFQPHRYSRFKGLWDEFLTAFEGTDLFCLCDVYAAGEKESLECLPLKFIQQMKGVKALYLKGSVSEIKDDIISLIQPDDIVITAGAGDITNLGRIICK